MISEQTAMTWMAEFNMIAAGDNGGSKGMEEMLRIQGNMLKDEPMIAALITQLLGALKIENPVHAALWGMAIYHDCLRRQSESDELSESV